MRKLLLVPVLLSVAACSGTGSDAGSPTPVDVAAWTGEMPISDPWLRRQLPAGTLSYERIPHPLGLLAIPKGNALDNALGSEANIQNLIAIQRGLAENLATDLPFVGLFETLRSPVEIAIVGMPAPSATIGATLGLRSDADFEAFIAQLGQFAPVALAGPLDADGFGQLIGAPLPILVNFDDATGRLALHGGTFADRAGFETLLASAAGEHPMHALEAQIDDSGQGLFAWVDAAQALQMSATFVPPDAQQTLNAMGANQIRAVALGTGVANGKGRLKLIADFGTGNANRPIPVVSNQIAASSVGDPRSLFLLSIPGTDEFARLESRILGTLPPEAAEGWAEAKAAFVEASGTSIEEVLAALGPELLIFSDDAGDFFGLHVRDGALLDSVLDRWATAVGAPIESRQVAGETVRYWELPGAFGVPDALREAASPAIAGILDRMRNRMYWIEDGDYLYLAGTPQVLIDRIAMGAGASVADWLTETQRLDVSSSLFAITGTADRLPQMMYNGYVGIMQTFADLVGAEYDVWAMPTANQLGLPERGSLGFAVNLGEPYVSLELSYESHPFELLLGSGGMAAVAGIGVAAAVAIPAYQDYTIRVQVTEGLNLAAAPKAAVVESWTGAGEAPADRAAAGMSPEATDTEGRYVQSIDIADGEILVRYGNQAHPNVAARMLTLTPYATADGGVVWACGYAAPPPDAEAVGAQTRVTTVEAQYLPSGCR
jgi:Tfp pilus assembly major pilin PilA